MSSSWANSAWQRSAIWVMCYEMLQYSIARAFLSHWLWNRNYLDILQWWWKGLLEEWASLWCSISLSSVDRPGTRNLQFQAIQRVQQCFMKVFQFLSGQQMCCLTKSYKSLMVFQCTQPWACIVSRENTSVRNEEKNPCWSGRIMSATNVL